MRHASIAFVVCTAAPAVLSQSTPLLSIPSDSGGQSAVGSDLTGDGVRELWIGAAYGNPGGPGRVDVHAGADGALLDTWHGEAVSDGFGLALEAVGDFDGDGIVDLAVGAPWWNDDAAHLPYAQVRSGRDGALLLRADGPTRYSGYGAALAGLGDVDGDGVPDVGVLARGSDGYGAPQEPAFAEVRSGASGALLWRTEAVSPGGWPAALARYDDLDGDGVSELAVGFSAVQRVEVRSGATGTVWMQLTAPPGAGFGYGTGFGAALDARGDFDGDGRTELLVGAPYEAITTGSPGGYEGHRHHGSVYVLAGAALDGPPAFRVTATPGETGFGGSVASIGDFSGDGVPDFVTGSLNFWTGCCHIHPGSARVCSGADGALVQQGWIGTNGQYSAAGDWDGDGLEDYLVTRGTTSASGVPSVTEVVPGVFPAPLMNVWCASVQVGCLPYAFTTGTPSAQSLEPFALHAGGYRGNVRGYLLLGTAERFDPFGAGTLCVGEVFARHAIEARSLVPPWNQCPVTLSYELPPGVLGHGRFAPGRTVFGQFFTLSPAGPGELGSSASIRVQVWP